MNKKLFLSLALSLILVSLFSQNSNVKPGIVGDKFTDFTLPAYQGGQVSTSELRGKNIVLVVPRGKYQDNAWCGLCQYQYAEFADLEINQHISEKYNLEIIFILPYNRDSVVKWEKAFPAAMTKIDEWKNPANPENMTEGQKGWMEFVKAHYPKSYTIKEGNVPLPFPVAIDENLEVSKGLDLSRTEWGGTKTLQNIPAIYIIDKEGVVRFKYISQSTVDRPSAEYVLNFIEKMGM